jgi:hypothetical protein
VRAAPVALVALLSAGACVPTVEFDVPVSADTSIQGGGLLGGLLGSLGFDGLSSMDLSDTREFSANDTRKEQVTSAKLTQLEMTVTAPADGNFDFLDEISFTAQAQGVDDAEVAHKTVPNGVTNFLCDIDGAELAPFVKADTMSITTDVTAHQPADDTTIHVDANFHISAEVVGK